MLVKEPLVINSKPGTQIVLLYYPKVVKACPEKFPLICPLLMDVVLKLMLSKGVCTYSFAPL